MSLTGANAVLMLSVPGLFDTPQQLQGFATDDIFDVEQVKRIETLMGVDGILSGGFVFNEKPMTITLQADSPSNFIFEQWDAAEQPPYGDVLSASMTVVLTGLSTKWSCINGFWTDAPPGGLAAIKKLVQPRKYTLRWEQVVPQRS